MSKKNEEPELFDLPEEQEEVDQGIPVTEGPSDLDEVHMHLLRKVNELQTKNGELETQILTLIREKRILMNRLTNVPQA